MIENIFNSILNMSIIGSIVAIIIICCRMVLKSRLPRILCYTMWVIVLMRLLVPFTLSSVFSIFNVMPKPDFEISPVVNHERTVEDDSLSIKSVTKQDYQGYSSHSAPIETIEGQVENKKIVDPISVVPLIWAAGAMIMFVFGFFTYYRVKTRLRTAVKMKDYNIVSDCSKRLGMKRNVDLYTSDRIDTPVVYGLFRMKIIIPLCIVNRSKIKELDYIITHELVHIKRFDNIIKLLSMVSLCIHWFNPIIWVCYYLSQKDMEISCDERAISVYNNDIRQDYASSLIKLASNQNVILNGGFIAFGESNIKSRIIGIMNFKKKKPWAIIATVVILTIVGAMLLTNGKYQGIDKKIYNSQGEYSKNEVSHKDKMQEIESGDTNSQNIENQTKTLVNQADNIEDAVSAAIKEHGISYGSGECLTEGHVILEVEEIGKETKVYTIASVGWFGFENGIFTKVSGSGAIPTVIEFSQDNGEYMLIDYKEPLDGAMLTSSIKELFPKRLHGSVLKYNDEYLKLKEQQEEQASKYLQSIGRAAKVTTSHVDKEMIDINVEAKNKLFAGLTKYDTFLNNCPYWIGTKEMVEDGIRYIYETSQGKSTDHHDTVIFTKTNENGTIILERVYKIVGKEPELISDGKLAVEKKELWKKDGWTYYIEQCIDEDISIGWVGQLIRKDSEGNFQIIDKLVEYRNNEAHIFASGDRIVFVGFAGREVMDFKTLTIVSIKEDGSDRRTYNPQYNVARNICFDEGNLYYEGWTNDRAFPRPLCRLDLMLSENIKMADINGAFITVNEGYVYYLDDSIYRLKLDWESKPELWDKAAIGKDVISVNRVSQNKYEVYYDKNKEPYVLTMR